MKNLEDLLYPFLYMYKNSPKFVKNVVGGVYAKLPNKLIYGKEYQYYINLIEQSEKYTSQDYLEFQRR